MYADKMSDQSLTISKANFNSNNLLPVREYVLFQFGSTSTILLQAIPGKGSGI